MNFITTSLSRRRNCSCANLSLFIWIWQSWWSSGWVLVSMQRFICMCSLASFKKNHWWIGFSIYIHKDVISECNNNCLSCPYSICLYISLQGWILMSYHKIKRLETGLMCWRWYQLDGLGNCTAANIKMAISHASTAITLARITYLRIGINAHCVLLSLQVVQYFGF